MSPFYFMNLDHSAMEEGEFRRVLFTLGRKYLQESIIFSAGRRPGRREKRNFLIYTTGERAGSSRSGRGFIDEENGNYSLIHTPDGEEIYIRTYRLKKSAVSIPSSNEPPRSKLRGIES